ncbi:glycosyltransferase family 2 protein [Pedobacter nototheniae]|uniref:glycosyltransferase family 2 protein n=1 Tax=Pedobacter nototheniae TaxID=2488994 RepID=UPI00293055D4|nr:glycosyltransferase family 2 protein [Pedobacter nototheniae]
MTGDNQNKNEKSWPWINEVHPDIYNGINNWPKISIVTPSYNQAKYIEETLLSIINQNYPNLEFIIVDGGSKDNTVEIIKKYESHLKYWISESDNGQVDAILKGLNHCTGQIFNWINSDDLLAEKALFNIAGHYLKNNKQKIIAGGCTHFTNYKNENPPTLVRNLTFNGLISEKSYFQQPSQWIILQNIQKLNIDKSLHYSFDWGMILNFDLKEEEINYLPLNLSYFREHEDAKTFKDSLLFKYEKLKIVKDYLKKTKNLKKKIVLFKYIFKLTRYLKVVTQIEKTAENNFSRFLVFGLKSPSLFFIRFYLGHLKTLFIEKSD